jgi:hypothetical protein
VTKPSKQVRKYKDTWLLSDRAIGSSGHTKLVEALEFGPEYKTLVSVGKSQTRGIERVTIILGKLELRGETW